MLFRHKAEITCKPSGDAAAGSRGKTKFFPDLFRAPGGVASRHGHTVFALAGCVDPGKENMTAEALRLCLGRLCLPGQREAPLVQRGDSMAQPCRGDCEAGGMIQLVFYCRVRRLAVNPSVGVRRQLPLHKGAVFAFLHRTCRARQRSLAVRPPDPPCAKGGQHGAAMQGGS